VPREGGDGLRGAALQGGLSTERVCAPGGLSTERVYAPGRATAGRGRRRGGASPLLCVRALVLQRKEALERERKRIKATRVKLSFSITF